MLRETWPIIVGGLHRSGTSLIRRILNAHSRIHCGPEVKFFRDFYSDYLQDPVGHLRFMASARSILPEPDLLEILGPALISLHQRAAQRAGKARWADKNPENVLYLSQWEKVLGDRWLMIQVARNPLDTLASIKEIKFPLSIPPGLQPRIKLYCKYTQAGLNFGAAHPDRYYMLVYEKLVRSPRATLEHLMNWLGEAFEDQQLNYNLVLQQRGLEDPKIERTQAIHTQSVARWSSILSREEALAIWVETQPLWTRIDPDGSFNDIVFDLQNRSEQMSMKLYSR